MDYRFNDEQVLLKESLEGWLSRNYGFEQWRGLAASDLGFAETNWHTFAEMGWLGIGIPEEFGGVGFGAVERMLIGEAFGRHLVNEPYLASSVLAGSLMLHAGSEAQKAEWLPRMAAGEARLALAFAETASRFDLNHVATFARRQASRWVLSGEKILVLDARAAERILILARTSGETGDRHGLGLFLIDPATEGLSLRSYTTVDDRRASDIVLDGVVAEALIGDDGGAFHPLERCLDEAILYLCAEALGAMEALFEMTRQYAKARRQFGQAIGDFQVIQHRLVDMRVQIECARALLLHAVAGEEVPGRYDEDAAAELTPALWQRLREVAPSLWREGRTYPRDSVALDRLFASGEVDLTMTYGPATLTELVADGTFPESTRVLELEDGTIGNASFLAMPATAGDPEGAMVVADLALSPEQQALKADPGVWGQFTVLDLDLLEPADRARFEELPASPVVPPYEELSRDARPELASDWVAPLDVGWRREVVGRR